MTSKPLKTLFLDIETAPNLGYTWQKYETNVIEFVKERYMLCFTVKWLDENKYYTFGLPDFPDYSKDPTNDKALMTKLWDFVNEADVIVGHNCIEENTPILTHDLKWLPAKDIKAGQKIVGFDENNSKNCPRKIKQTTVIDNFISPEKCLKIKLSNGEEIITSEKHKWLKLAPKGRDYRWCESKNLKIGQRVEKFFNVWKKEETYDAGWLSGFIAGEGTLKKAGESSLGSIDFCQRPGITWDQAIKTCMLLGIEISPGKTKKGGLGKGDCLYTYTKGGKFKTAEILGRLRPERLINKIDWNSFGTLRGKNTETVEIIGIEEAGIRNVCVLTTDSKTYFASGYAMHNCDSFDIKIMNTRFIVNGFTPPSPYKTVDTKKEAKKRFGFNSNSLNDLGRLFGFGKKLDTGGFKLWTDCMAGDLDAWKKMKKYNKIDVALLEQVYLKLRGWMKSHPNVSVTLDRTCCQVCGSNNTQKRGFSFTKLTKYQRIQCMDCHSWSQGTIVK